MIKFPSIMKYSNVVRNVREHVTFAGSDDSGKAIFNSKILPILKFTGRVKLHGTNAAITKTGNEHIKFQSRNRILTVDDDNAGFVKFCTSIHELEIIFDKVKTYLSSKTEYDDYSDIIAVYGEWCGSGIMKRVAIEQLDKMFVIFAIRIGNEDNHTWLRMSEITSIELPEHRIFNIQNFKTYDIDIDFSNPKLVQNTLNEMMLEVEKECPVAKQFGISGIGEGLVFSCEEPGYEGSEFRFKVKGQSHSKSKVRKLANVDIEKLNSIKEFVDNKCDEERLQQGIDYLNENKIEVTEKATSDFIRWIINDIIKEETDVMEASGLTSKDIGKSIATSARIWYFNYVAD